MAKSERAQNPAQAQHKADKARALKKSKAQIQTQRTERLARRNPERLQRQIDELKSLQERQNGELRPKDRETLVSLERDVAGIRKAREKAGDKAPQFGRSRDGDDRERRGGAESSALGKRRRGSQDAGARGRGERHGYGRGDDDDENASTDTEDGVRDIPMPRDTPPPIPRQHLRNGPGRQQLQEQGPPGVDGDDKAAGKPAEKEVPKTTYSAAPALRDFQKEASRFVPAAVATRRKKPVAAEKTHAEEMADETMRDGKEAAEAALKEEILGEVIGDDKDMPEDDDDEERLMRDEEAAFEREMAEEEERKQLKREAMGDANKAAEEAMREEDLNATVEEGEMARLKNEGLDDTERIAEEATKEAEFMAMADGVKNGEGMEKRLRHVEIEEVEDEDA